MARRGAVLFDAAGTLIALREPVGETYARVAGDCGVHLPAHELSQAFHRVFGEAPAMVFPNASPDATAELERSWWREVVRATFCAVDPNTRFDDFPRFFDALFRTMGRVEAWCEAPGAQDALTELRSRGWQTAVVSNFDRRLVSILEGLGLAPLFDAIVLASDAAAAKPDAAIFDYALEQLGANRSDTFVVGDDPGQDLAGARRAGLRAIDVGSLANLRELVDLLEAAVAGPGKAT